METTTEKKLAENNKNNLRTQVFISRKILRVPSSKINPLHFKVTQKQQF
jgi:hypothetical protein